MKHAYLIMAHHRPDLLRELISALDDERNDIYLHIDKKTIMDVDWDIKTSKSCLYLIERMPINWGGYSQIYCEYRLLEAAVKNGPYQYYHLLTGSTFPLKNPDAMHAFFRLHSGKEFVGFDDKRDYSDRVKYCHLFCEAGKLYGLSGKMKGMLRRFWIFLQKAAKVDLFSRYGLICKKGTVYWSITEHLANYLLEKEQLVHDMLLKSVSGDEIFVQTLVYNSEFLDKVYCMDNEYEGSSREIAWENYGRRPGHNFLLEDLDILVSSQKCFALKFEGKNGTEIIEKIKKEKYSE